MIWCDLLSREYEKNAEKDISKKKRRNKMKGTIIFFLSKQNKKKMIIIAVSDSNAVMDVPRCRR